LNRVVTVDPLDVRRTILDLLYRAKASHLGSSMSMVEMLVAAFGSVDVAKIRDRSPDRSRIIVSKGHAACATYATMHHYGLLDRALLETYHQNGSLLAGHVSHGVPRVEHSTGALGHGLPVACGCALGLRSRGYDDASVLCLLGDGEIQEGAVWEAWLFARHHRLTNLVSLIDNNGISSITRTERVIDMRPMRGRFEGLGFRVHDVDGHDVKAIRDAIADLRRSEVPGIVICNTIKGRGVPFAENDPIWHYRSLNDDTYRQAVEHLEKQRRA
jgi:transketolase